MKTNLQTLQDLGITDEEILNLAKIWDLEEIDQSIEDILKGSLEVVPDPQCGCDHGCTPDNCDCQCHLDHQSDVAEIQCRMAEE